LAVILDQALQLTDVPTDPRFRGDVDSEWKSLQGSKNSSPTDTSQFQLKAGGSYNLMEFRQLLQQVTELSAQHRYRKLRRALAVTAVGTDSAAGTSAVKPLRRCHR